MATLTFDDGSGPREHALDPRGTTVGRLPSCDIVIPDPSVSRRHAAIWRAADGWRVRDLNSRAGVRIEGQRVTDHPLGDSCVLTIGAIDLTLDLRGRATGPRSSPRSGGLVSSQSLSSSMLMRSLGSDAAGISDLGRVVRTAAALRVARSPERIADTVLEEALLATGAERGLLSIIDDARQPLETWFARRNAFSPSSTFIRRVLEEEVALIAVDVREDSELAAAASIALQGVGSLLCAPLWTGSRIAGVLYLDRRTGRFDPAQIELVLALGYLGAAELERLETADHLAREKHRRRSVARLLPQELADELAAASGDFELQEGRVALVVAQVVGSGEVDGQDARELVETALGLVIEESSGRVVTADPDEVQILHRADDDTEEHTIAAARTARHLLEISEALRRTRSRWADLRLKIVVHVGTAAVGLIGEAERARLAVVGEAVDQAHGALKGGRAGRIRVTEQAGPSIAPHFDIVPERDGGSLAIWMLPRR